MKIYKTSSISPSEEIKINETKRIRLSIPSGISKYLNEIRSLQQEMVGVINQSDFTKSPLELEHVSELNKLVKMAQEKAQKLIQYLKYLDSMLSKGVQQKTQDSLNPMI